MFADLSVQNGAFSKIINDTRKLETDQYSCYDVYCLWTNRNKIKMYVLFDMIHVFKNLIVNSKIFSLYDFTIFFKIKES